MSSAHYADYLQPAIDAIRQGMTRQQFLACYPDDKPALSAAALELLPSRTEGE